MQRADLNEDQIRAVQDTSKACLVRANVGSGKTTVLTEKVRFLHEKGVPYEAMAVLTFTNKAADEIRHRLGAQQDELRLCGTFHSVCMQLLKEDLPVETIGYGRDFQIITPEEELELAQLLIKEHKLKIKYPNRLKKRLEAGNAGGAVSYDDDFLQLRAFLDEEKRGSGRMNFDELIAHAAALCHHMRPLQWVIIDEVQDCDRKQLDLIDALMQEETSLFAVGDPSQMIYGWRSASLNVFYILKERYDAAVYDLPINYRCSDAILKAARRFQQSGSPVEGIRGEGQMIPLHTHYDPFAEAGYLADRIARLKEDGYGYRDIAVLYRLQEQASLLVKILENAGIPCEISQKQKLQDIPVLVWICRVLRAALSRQDGASLKLALEDKRFCAKKKKQLEEVISSFEMNMNFFSGGITGNEPEQWAQLIWDVLQLDVFIRPADADYQENRRYVMACLSRLCMRANPNEIRNETHDDVTQTDASAEGRDILSCIREGLNRSSLAGSEFLLEKPQEDAVRLMTLHASKGLEFRAVFIIGINNGLLPLRGKGSDQEEEMRLFYVGMTRAKDILELSCYINPGMARVDSGESMFLRMIPQTVLQRDDAAKPAVSLQELRSMVLRSRQEMKMGEAPDSTNDVDIGEIVSDSPESAADIDTHNYADELSASLQGDYDAGAEQCVGALDQLHTEKSQPDQEEHPDTAPKGRLVRHPHYGTGRVVWEDSINIRVEFDGYGEKEFIIAFSQLIEA